MNAGQFRDPDVVWTKTTQVTVIEEGLRSLCFRAVLAGGVAKHFQKCIQQESTLFRVTCTVQQNRKCIDQGRESEISGTHDH